jgi:two-component system nitrogen regulation response regulator NtrX
MKQVKERIAKVARSMAPILVRGESGTGKELVARAVHACSHRSEGPFVAVNCSAIPETLLEAEFFGAKKGSYTGATSDREGYFQAARGGTLFLDEIGDLPLPMQSKLLRAIQERHVRSLGSTQEDAVDVRIVSATHKDLAADVQAGRFRQDLFYRLNVVPMRVPALRERRDDIPELLEHFMRVASEQTGLPLRTFGEDTLALLQAYDWPGNVRQLRNVVDWLLIMAPGDPGEAIRADMLPPDIGAANAAGMSNADGTEVLSLPLREAREIFERKYLESQVSRFGGNISRTASFVGMERSALHRKLRSLGITGSERGDKVE